MLPGGSALDLRAHRALFALAPITKTPIDCKTASYQRRAAASSARLRPKYCCFNRNELGQYQADSWKHSQRLILVIVDEPDSEGLLFDMPRYFFLVTNHPRTTRSGWNLLRHYRQRGTFEDRLSEFNAVLGPHLSQNDCWKNDVSLVMALLAFNLSSLLRLELEAAHGGSWDLVRFRDCVLKAGGRVVKHGNRLVVKLAKAVSAFWSTLSARVARWRLPTTYPTRTGPQPRNWMPPPAHAHLELVHRE